MAVARAAVILSALCAKSSITVTPRATPTVWKRRPTPWKEAKGATGCDGRKSVGNIVPARHRQTEAYLFDGKAATRGVEFNVVSANVGAWTEAEAKRAAGERIEILVLAHHQGFARARTQHGKHFSHLRHLLVVALEVEDDADSRRIANERAVALVRLDNEEI